MNKIPYINNKANDSKLLNENCVIINPIFSKKNSKYDEEEIFNLAENINLKALRLMPPTLNALSE